MAEVTLKTYTEDDLATLSDQKDVTFETGTVRIQAFPAEKKSDHGTEIILLNLRQQTKDLLRSRDVWLRTDPGSDQAEISNVRPAPKYHIGRLEPGSEDILSVPEELRWDRNDPPEDKFRHLFQAIIDEVGVDEQNPKLETVLDNYLRTLWDLSLSAPIDYIEKHPFDLTAKDDPELRP